MVENGLPFRHGLLGDQGLEVGEQRSRVFPAVGAVADLGGEALVAVVGRPVTVVGRVRRHDPETGGGETVGAVQDGRGGLVLATAVADDDQRTRAGGLVVRDPGNGGYAVDGEELFANTHAEPVPFGVPSAGAPRVTSAREARPVTALIELTSFVSDHRWQTGP